MISVIVPAYNSERTIVRCVDSILGQRQSLKEELEVVVVDDASKDRTYSILRRMESVKVLVNPFNQGLYQSRMNALGVCSGDRVLFVDADDWLEDGAIARLAEHDEDIVTMGFQYRLTRLNIPHEVILKKAEGTLADNIIRGIGEFSPSVWGKLYSMPLLERTVFPRFDSFWGEDRIFNLAVMEQNPTVKVLDYIGYNYKWGGQSKTFQPHAINQYRYFVQTIKRWKGESDALSECWDELRRYYVRNAIVDSKWSKAQIIEKAGSSEEEYRQQRNEVLKHLYKYIISRVL